MSRSSLPQSDERSLQTELINARRRGLLQANHPPGELSINREANGSSLAGPLCFRAFPDWQLPLQPTLHESAFELDFSWMRDHGFSGGCFATYFRQGLRLSLAASSLRSAPSRTTILRAVLTKHPSCTFVTRSRVAVIRTPNNIHEPAQALDSGPGPTVAYGGHPEPSDVLFMDSDDEVVAVFPPTLGREPRVTVGIYIESFPCDVPEL